MPCAVLSRVREKKILTFPLLYKIKAILKS